MVKILIVEDEPQLLRAMSRNLSNENFSVIESHNGAHALDIFHNEHVDLIVTDIMMPLMNGYEFVEEIRKVNKEIPIIMLTALGELADKISGFNSGTDDYLVKPISLKELTIRIKAMLRRMKINSEQIIELNNTLLDSKTQKVVINGKSIDLNKKQFQLLFKLLLNPNIVFGREQLLNEIWGFDNNSTDRTVDTHISWLRTKAKSPDYEIVSVWGLGYKVVLK